MTAIELSPPSRWEKVRRKVAVAAGLVLAATGVVGVSQPASAVSPLTFPTPATCTIQTFTGNYVTAVGGGGQITDVIHTNATVPQGWETFRVVDAGGGHVGIVAATGNYLTTVGGGGRTTDVIHSNATLLQGWEEFNLVPIAGQPGNVFGIQTFDGHYLTAVGGGGRTTDAIHSDAIQAQGWEWFRFNCNQSSGTANTMAWGANGAGQVGAGAPANQLRPRSVPSLPRDVTQVAAFGHSLALRADGTVLAWGPNQSGELGLGIPPDSDDAPPVAHPPQPVPGITGVVQIAAGSRFSLALRSDGTVWGWGDNGYGEMGVGADPVHQLTPRQVPGLAQVVKIAAGFGYGLALLADGTVRAWGSNSAGQLGDGHPTFAPAPAPVVVSGLSGVTQIGAGWYHSLAVLGDGSVRTWGDNQAGQLGNGTRSASSTPVVVTGLNNVVQIDGGEIDSVALRGDGTVWAWGDNTYDQVDASGDRSVLTPRRVPMLAVVTQIAAGDAHNLAVLGDGSLWAWGYGGDGERGDGTGQLPDRVNVSTPVRVFAIAQVVHIAAGGTYSIATAAVSVVPNLQYSDPVSAAQFLIDAGLTVGPNTPATGQCGFFGDGWVIGQDIAAGTLVPPGTPVNYFFDCIVP